MMKRFLSVFDEIEANCTVFDFFNICLFYTHIWVGLCALVGSFEVCYYLDTGNDLVYVDQKGEKKRSVEL